MFDIDYEALEQGVYLMGTGMLGIFTVLFILYLVSFLLIHFFPPKDKKAIKQNGNQE